MHRTIPAVGACLVSLILATTATAVMIMPLDVEEMTQRAGKIFVGTCTKVEREVNAQGMPIVAVTFTVSEAIKGEVGQTVTFRQIDPTARAQSEAAVPQSSRFRVRSLWSAAALANVPSYAPGEEALLFLGREGKLGLTAPVGLSQGKFPVRALGSGEKVITNTALKTMPSTGVAFPEPGKTAQYGYVVKTIRALAQSAR